MAQRFNFMALIMFIAIGLVAGLITNWITPMIGLGTEGIMGSLVFLTIFFLLFAWIGGKKLGATGWLWFVVFGLIASFISGWLATAIGVTGIMASALFLIVFYVLYTWIGRRRR
ncbi:hypothetical protein DRO69_01995 [Candidatus Bathyarchaeota archaeon]|nr:MAG: hypothetical protein DRO69_01995 [Candidatus Bathyarchaeota archaeon]